MEEMNVRVCRVDSVIDHPNADRLSLVTIDGHTCVSAKLADGTPRYKVGDRAVRVPPGLKVPDWLLRKGFYSEEKGKGLLGGQNGDIVEASKVRGVVSEGILFSVDQFEGYDESVHFCLIPYLKKIMPTEKVVEVGDDVAYVMGITRAC